VNGKQSETKGIGPRAWGEECEVLGVRSEAEGVEDRVNCE
jgi:hypothetical protein